MKESTPELRMHADHGGHRHTIDEPEQALKDPVCGMAVTDQSPHSLQHEGKLVYFCSAGCRRNCGRTGTLCGGAAGWPGGAPATAPPESAAATYTCPMHPEIRQDHPGNCPARHDAGAAAAVAGSRRRQPRAA